MFIVSGLHRVFIAPEERNVAEANPRLQHFAPLELLSFGNVRIYKHSAPLELNRLVSAALVSVVNLFHQWLTGGDAENTENAEIKGPIMPSLTVGLLPRRQLKSDVYGQGLFIRIELSTKLRWRFAHRSSLLEKSLHCVSRVLLEKLVQITLIEDFAAP